MSKLLKNSIVVSSLGLGTALLNFVSQMVIAAFFGANGERDAFFAASVIPIYINTIILGSLSAVFLPKLIDTRMNNQQAVHGLIDGVVTFAILFLSLLGLSIGIFSSQVVPLLFSGFGEEDVRLTANLVMLLVPAMILQPLCTVLGVVYHAERRFLLPASCFVIIPVSVIIAALIMRQTLGIRSLAIGSSLGYILVFSILQFNLPIRYKLRPQAMIDSREAKACLQASLPWIFGGFIYRGGTVAERMVASGFPVGVVSYLGYAGGLITTLSAIMMNGIGTTIFPALAEAWTLRDLGKLRNLFGLSLKFTLVVCIPIMMAIVAFDETIVATVFERGAFTRTDTRQVSVLLSVMTITFLFNCLNTVPSKLLYVTGTSGLAIVNGFLEVGIYIVGAVLLSRSFSYPGIAYAQALSTACSTVFVVSILEIKYKILRSDSLAWEIAKILFFGVLIYLCMISYKLFYGEQSFLISLLFGGVSFVIYGFLIISFLPEGRLITRMISSKLNKILRLR